MASVGLLSVPVENAVREYGVIVNSFTVTVDASACGAERGCTSTQLEVGQSSFLE
jgi:hypothetical protein